ALRDAVGLRHSRPGSAGSSRPGRAARAGCARLAAAAPRSVSADHRRYEAGSSPGRAGSRAARAQGRRDRVAGRALCPAPCARPLVCGPAPGRPPERGPRPDTLPGGPAFGKARWATTRVGPASARLALALDAAPAVPAGRVVMMGVGLAPPVQGLTA